MKKYILSVLLSVMVLVSFFDPVGRASAAGTNKTIALQEFRFIAGKGWVVVFAYTGNWTRADLKGNTLSVDGISFDLHCNFQKGDDGGNENEPHSRKDGTHAGTISCTMPSLEPYIHQMARFFFAGQSFIGIVPPKSTSAGSGFSECPIGMTETVYVQVFYNGGSQLYQTSYVAETSTIADAVADIVAYVELFFNVTVDSTTVTDVLCEQPN